MLGKFGKKVGDYVRKMMENAHKMLGDNSRILWIRSGMVKLNVIML